MTDNTDRSSRSSLTLGISDVAARLQNLRNLLNNERHNGARQQRALEALNREMDEMSADRVPDGTEWRRRRDFEALRSSDTTPTADEITTSNSPSTLVRTRRRAFRPSERLQRHQRERLSQEARYGSNSGYMPAVPPNQTNPSSHSDECYGRPPETIASKRRKLDDGTYEDESRTFSYGHKGQVVPGHLKMEIVSCDGGEFSAPYIRVSSWPQSVLSDDKAVYSTKTNRCNILFKHVGGMPFTLTKLVVRAPGPGYDAPVQEGIVFISMTDEKLLEDTAHYEKKYRTHDANYQRRHYSGVLPPSHEYLHSTRSPLRSYDRTRVLRETILREIDLYDIDVMPTSAHVPGFNVTLGDDSEGEEDIESPLSPRPWLDLDAEYSLRSYADRYRQPYSTSGRGQADSATSSESEDEGDASITQPHSDIPPGRYEFSAEQRRIMLNSRRRTTESGVSALDYVVEDAYDPEYDNLHPENHDFVDHGPEPQILEPPIVPGESLPPEHRSTYTSMMSLPPKQTHHSESTPSTTKPKIAPHAHFFIRRNKSSVSIKFDPPVAGRYILLKLWASCPNNNIDIQSIIPYGYGGPRFFPCSELR